MDQILEILEIPPFLCRSKENHLNAAMSSSILRMNMHAFGAISSHLEGWEAVAVYPR